MKLYRVHMHGDFDACSERSIWFTRKSEYPKNRNALIALCLDAESRPAPVLEAFNVPTTKERLCAFLNSLEAY